MSATPLDENRVQQAFRQFATGVVVVVGRRSVSPQPAGDQNNATRTIVARARAFNSLSLDPPLLLWILDKASPSFADFKASTAFAIHILADDQQALMHHAEALAKPELCGPDWSAHPELGLPIHGRCAAWFACDHVSYFDADDHGIFVGEIRDCAFNERRPLVHCAGQYLVPCHHPAHPPATVPVALATG